MDHTQLPCSVVKRTQLTYSAEDNTHLTYSGVDQTHLTYSVSWIVYTFRYVRCDYCVPSAIDINCTNVHNNVKTNLQLHLLFKHLLSEFFKKMLLLLLRIDIIPEQANGCSVSSCKCRNVHILVFSVTRWFNTHRILQPRSLRSETTLNSKLEHFWASFHIC